ncbi:hypothetical protein [Aquimarina mytili]|uniref:Uncharacterized protein n=1 Tax=Aquimarina mytili TaxID=874423 RepID=A0A937A2S9_9FLAO|nr:hypothetical protein [Aquimarina mytili]MBL0683344.1 hypothetical protein [Aquimarina mytili]
MKQNPDTNTENRKPYYAFLSSGVFLFSVTLALTIISSDYNTINPKSLSNIFTWIKILGVIFIINAFVLIVMYWNLSLKKIVKVLLTIFTVIFALVILAQITANNPKPIVGTIRLPKEGKIIYVTKWKTQHGALFSRVYRGISIYYHTDGEFRTNPPINAYGIFRKLLRYKTHAEIIIGGYTNTSQLFGLYSTQSCCKEKKYRIDYQSGQVEEVNEEENID